MKIRLVSIDGKLADPIYNVGQIKKEIEKADEENIDLLVFPANSIVGESIGLEKIHQNSTFYDEQTRAEMLITNHLNKPRNCHVMINEFLKDIIPGVCVVLHNAPTIQTVEKYFSLEEDMRKESIEKYGALVIACYGRGTESGCQNVYSNTKMIAYKGEILASNLDSDSNILDYEINEEGQNIRYPYLNGIKDYDKMFKYILNMQGAGLYSKMKGMNRFKICMGVSGGLDSTVALLECVEIFKKYKLPLKNIIGVTMPGLGTTERTHKNALDLMKALGITIEEIDLRPLLKTHLKNISQPEGKFDVTFEQTQSRERTQVLLDIANRDNAIMIGTGCMSEFALGWMTYGGDHLSMYALNIGLPKTVVKMYARWFINKKKKVAPIVKDILEGPVSPELLPIDEKGEQHEKTESLIGDYAVQDFFIYHTTVNACSMRMLFKEACAAFPEYDNKTILKWLKIFCLRFFTRAFKKNCYGDGLSIFNYSVSPWFFHIPSDIDNTIWTRELEDIEKELK